ncbi:MAG: cyclic nucleotide-binding domain-containing protein [Acidobacteriaceae bacterium]|nr:cyclic nucleotide-binding domain-containing protein [Acidobacteriaceae bacterium]
MSAANPLTGAMAEEPLVVALRRIPLFADLAEPDLEWFASRAEDLHYATGEVLAREGEPANGLIVMLEGEINARRESHGGDAPLYIARAGQVTGYLPFSRMTHYKGTIRAAAPTRIARLMKDHIDEMLQRIPLLLPRLVGLMADRIREVSRADQQREKLMALGKFSAGLAHELNNPAAAARRSAEGLRQAMVVLRKAKSQLEAENLSHDQRMHISRLEEETLARALQPVALDPIEQSDREDQLLTWLEDLRVPEAWKLAPELVENGITQDMLGAAATSFSGTLLGAVLQRLVTALTAQKLIGEIENATGRISDLVRAIKEYSYMDQAPEQEVDIHQGIESTLTMLKFRLKKGVTVTKEFDRTLPRLCAHGSELNQVWTNLIDNAVDAMGGNGELTIRTSRVLDYALVEVIDHGPGIPEDLKPHIFEPFFTTKGVGEGTGLGLDAVYRIVRHHHGEVTFTSRPGETNFQVRLPFKQPA